MNNLRLLIRNFLRNLYRGKKYLSDGGVNEAGESTETTETITDTYHSHNLSNSVLRLSKRLFA